MKKLTTLLLCFLFPSPIIFWVLNLLGHKIHPRTRIGFSLIWINGTLTLREGSKIGHFNIVKTNKVFIDKQGYIGSWNNLRGPFEIYLAETGAIGNGNQCSRAPIGVTYGTSVLKLGILSKLTSNHRVDCTRSVTIGDYTTIAGHNCELWTHAYYHDKTGPGRFRLDGEIEIGSNVYIGSRCVINCGVKITDQVIVGANACISKSILKPGTYVSQPLRFLESADIDARTKFQKVEVANLVEEVYERKGMGPDQL